MNALGVLLPVYNTHHRLEESVLEILEVVAELTDRFELCILDDGSTDDTGEVAHDLATRYPQIRVIRHRTRLGLAEAIRSGLEQAQGEVILIGDENYILDPNDLRVLWQLRDAQRNLTSRSKLLPAVQEPWLEKLLAWKPCYARRQHGFQMICRGAYEQYRLQQAAAWVARVDSSDRQAGAPVAARPNFLSKVKRFALGE